MGGRRRRSMKKTRKTRKMRGGNFYGGVPDAQIGSAGLRYDAVANSRADPVTGATLPEIYGGGRRRRSSKKTKKGGRKSRKVGRKGRKTMRGGANMVGSPNSGASFGGQGIAGLATYGGYPANVNGAGGPTQGGDGVYRV